MSNISTVVLDAGHGGRDAGAVGNGLKEKDLTLSIALEAEKHLLANYTGVKVSMTRRTDKYLTLKQRVDIANGAKADFFMSIHINSASNPNATGYESFVSTSGSNIAMTTRAHDVLANYFKDTLKVANRGLKKMNFYVIAKTNMPAILTESLFINNPSDAKLLKDNVKEIGRVHAEAVAAALRLKRRAGTTAAQTKTEKEVDEMAKKLSPTAQKDMRELLQHAYDTKVFSKNHTNKVANMTLGEALDLVISYQARTLPKTTK